MQLARQYNIPWKGRNYDVQNWDAGDEINRCISVATSMHGLSEAAVLAAGYAPAVGFIHSGKPLSFVYNIADLFKFDTVVPVAFQVTAKRPANLEREVRLRCRDVFRQSKLLKRIIPTIEKILAASGLEPPKVAKEAVPIAIPNNVQIDCDVPMSVCEALRSLC